MIGTNIVISEEKLTIKRELEISDKIKNLEKIGKFRQNLYVWYAPSRSSESVEINPTDF